MRTSSINHLAAALVFGLAAATTSDLYAEDAADEGVVRLTDQPSAAVYEEEEGITIRAQSPHCPRTAVCRTAPSVPVVVVRHRCDGGSCCSHRQCYSGPGLPLGTVLHAPCDLCDWWHSPHVCFQSPDHGWGPPIKTPVPYYAAEYQAYWPKNWTGQAATTPIPSYETIYQPTDTAQLGFYYQNVPTWRPNPGMLPSPPLPSAWHTREGSVWPGTSHGVIGVHSGHHPASKSAPPAGANATRAVTNGDGRRVVVVSGASEPKKTVKKVRVVRRVANK